MNGWCPYLAACWMLTICACDASPAPQQTPAGSANASATSPPESGVGPATPAPATGLEGRYVLDAAAYRTAMAEAWKQRYSRSAMGEAEPQLTASGWVELEAGGIANSNLTTSMGGGPASVIAMVGTWSREGEVIRVTPDDPTKSKALTCALTDQTLTCTPGANGPTMLFVKP